MLVLTRKPGESILIENATIADKIVVVLSDMNRNRALIGIEAPKSVSVFRSELIDSAPVLMPEDLSADACIRRLRSLKAERRQEIIRQIVTEFCGKPTPRQLVSAGV